MLLSLSFWCRKRAECDDTVVDAPIRAEKFAQRYFLSQCTLIICICKFGAYMPLFELSPLGSINSFEMALRRYNCFCAVE